MDWYWGRKAGINEVGGSHRRRERAQGSKSGQQRGEKVKTLDVRNT